MTSKDVTDHSGLISKILAKNGVPSESSIKRYEGGQINYVYQIGDDYVLKIEKDLDVTPHQASIVQLAFDAGAKVPRIFDSGEIDSKNYILMERMEGKKLSEGWMDFDEGQKENFIRQICEQMKIFHSIKFDKYSPQRPKEFDTLLEAIDWQTNLDDVDLKDLDDTTRGNFEKVRQFYEDNKMILDERDTAVFVHNDLHFDNILYEGDQVTGIIDFDFTRQLAKDYELWHIVDFFLVPKYYLGTEELEQIWKGFELGNELKLFKKYYPELFDHPDLTDRLRLYFIDQIVSDLRDGAVMKFNERIEPYFESDWLERSLEIV